MFEEEKKMLKSFAALLDVIGGFGRDAQSSNMSWGANDIAGRKFPTPKSLGKSPDSPEYVGYVVYVSRSAWLFRLIRLAEKEIAYTQETQDRLSLSAPHGKKSYECARQIEKAVYDCGLSIPDSEELIGLRVLSAIAEEYDLETEKSGVATGFEVFREFIENVAFRLTVPDGILPPKMKVWGKIHQENRLTIKNSKSKNPKLNERGKELINPEGKVVKENNEISDSSGGGVDDKRSPLPAPDLAPDQALIVLASSWHGVALLPVSPGQSVQPADYLLNDKSEDKYGNGKVRGAECVTLFMCDDFQISASRFPVADLDKQTHITISDDSRTRKMFIVAEAARAMIEIGVASRFFSHIVRPVGSRFDTNESTYSTQSSTRAVPAFRKGGSVLRTHLWFGVPLGLLITLWVIVGSAIIVYSASSVSPSQSSALPLGALGVALVLTTMLSMLSFRLFVGVSFGSKRAFKGRITRKTLKDQMETELDHSTMLRRLRAQLSARSVRFWTDLHQDHKVWGFAEDVVENRLGIRNAEQHIIRALDDRIAASSDFKLDVVSYQRRQSRWLRIVFAGAVSAFVALEFMELITEWFGLHYGQSVYDLIGCVAQSEGSTDGGCSASSLTESLTESKNFRVSSILAVFAAIGAVVVGTVIALGRKLDDDD